MAGERFVRHSRQAAAQIGIQTARMVMQDIGVELTPGELGDQPIRTRASMVGQVGQQCTGMEHPELQVWRQVGPPQVATKPDDR